ncbi:MAG: 50S ribosomal protein L10 [Oscillospiraceae bacterium]|nr:50S ribosomal protein L10 [Oscillospiraceae bacterium]
MPSAKVLEIKKARVAELTELLKESAAGVLVDYRGINVAEDTKLRKELREADINYFVEKNSLLCLAFRNVGLEKLEDVLEGPTAIALSKADQTAPARILGKFSESKKDIFNLKAGFIGTELYDQKGVNALSKIPSKDTLLSQLVYSMQGPIQKLAATLKALEEKRAAEEGAA